MSTTHRPTRRHLIGTGLALAGILTFTACSSNSTSTTTAADTNAIGNAATTVPPTTGTGGGQVLPVDANPIQNTATEPTLHIDSVLVENNVDTAGKTTDDHLEIALSNSGATDLSGLEVFFTFADPTTTTSESYYTKLPADFTIPAGGSRIAHFDNTGAADHFTVNQFSLYYTDTNALDVTVEVSATGAAVQTTTLQKDAGGAETAD